MDIQARGVPQLHSRRFLAGGEAAESFLRLLQHRRTDAIVDLFAGPPTIDAPLGRVAPGDSDVRAYLGNAAEWLAERKGSVEQVAMTTGERRAVAEQTLHLRHEDSWIELPIAVVADRAEGAGVSEIRVYHSTWPLTGRHLVRPPVLPARTYLAPPDVVGDYQEALAAGDIEGILSTFAEDAVAREPSGGDFIYRGKPQLRHLYEAMFGNGGGIPLVFCSITDDGVRCAIEYIVMQWGRTVLPPQAGIAVYERDDDGLLKAARIYDDVEPPRPTATSH